MSCFVQCTEMKATHTCIGVQITLLAHSRSVILNTQQFLQIISTGAGGGGGEAAFEIRFEI